MDRVDLLAALRRDGDAFADAASVAGLTTPVPACPGWDVAELVWHLGEVHRFWGEIVERRLSDPELVARFERPGDAELLAWYRAGLDHLIDVLRSAGGGDEVWTWSARKDADFVVRRMAQETLVHRIDAEAAAERQPVIDADLASDGIDEFLEHFTVWRSPDAARLGGTVHLHCTDVAGEWLVTEVDDGPLVTTREHAKGTVAMRGPAADLLMVLWRRAPVERAELIGDRGVAERLVARTALD